MTEVIVTICNSQKMDGEVLPPIELVAPGRYYKKEGLHYLFFDIVMEGDSDVTKTRIRFNEKQVYLTRKGAQRGRMVFGDRKENVSMYRTPFGVLMFEIDTKKIEVKEEPKQVDLTLEYSMKVENTHYSENTVSVCIQSKEGLDFSLL